MFRIGERWACGSAEVKRRGFVDELKKIIKNASRVQFGFGFNTRTFVILTQKKYDDCIFCCFRFENGEYWRLYAEIKNGEISFPPAALKRLY